MGIHYYNTTRSEMDRHEVLATLAMLEAFKPGPMQEIRPLTPTICHICRHMYLDMRGKDTDPVDIRAISSILPLKNYACPEHGMVAMTQCPECGIIYWERIYCRRAVSGVRPVYTCSLPRHHPGECFIRKVEEGNV